MYFWKKKTSLITMKIFRLLILVILVAGFTSCHHEANSDPAASHNILDDFKGKQFSGLLGDKFIWVDAVDFRDDTLTGNYIIQHKGAIVTRMPFSIYLKADSRVFLSSPDHKGEVDVKSLSVGEGVELVIVKKRKILWIIPAGKKEVTLKLNPYRMVKTPVLEGRYEKDLFPEMRIQKDVVYGEADGYWTSFYGGEMSYWEILSKGTREAMRTRDLPLLMDVYLPEGDTLKSRPLLVLIHGGGFYVGDKGEPTYIALAHNFVRKGYVVASINYRMGFRISSKEVERAGYRAVQDARAALRFLSSHSDEYGIDPECVYLAGSSAGAITALNVAFMDEDERPEAVSGGIFKDDLGPLDSAGNSLIADYKVKAVINMWGAVDNTGIIDDDEQIALMHFHGDSDRIVPYGCGVPFENVGGRWNKWLMPEMCGSAGIHDVVTGKSWNSELITFENMGHMPHLNPDKSFNENFDTIMDRSGSFFYQNTAGEEVRIIGDLRCRARQDRCNYSLSENNFNVKNWSVTGGIIASYYGDSVDVLWFRDENIHEVHCQLMNQYGAVVNIEAEVKVP
ncbi:MAG: hypothetical protein C0593_14525 [Marinilabiliales bacterium]|nr:MAG: hypothetical protein C0593_14525 [Marinilabiliales bacterium]